MKNLSKQIGTLLILLIWSSSLVTAQTNFTVDPASTMTITGTSSMHDWEEDVETINGSMTAVVANGVLKDITALSLTIPVESIESGKSIMNNKTYDALKSEKHPNITFKLTEITNITQMGSRYIVKGKGRLTIAGVTKEVNLMVAMGMENGELLAKGSTTINMLDYNMEPPVAMMGAMKVGEKVNVKYDLQWAVSDETTQQ